MTCDRATSNIEKMEFDWWNTIEAHEKLPDVHVMQ